MRYFLIAMLLATPALADEKAEYFSTQPENIFLVLPGIAAECKRELTRQPELDYYGKRATYNRCAFRQINHARYLHLMYNDATQPAFAKCLPEAMSSKYWLALHICVRETLGLPAGDDYWFPPFQDFAKELFKAP